MADTSHAEGLGIGPSTSSPADEVYLTRRQLRSLLGGISDMTLHRWRFGYTDKASNYHPPLSAFPKPILVGSHPMWCKSEMIAWLRSRPVMRFCVTLAA